jgi:hypothetical protein
MTEPTIDFIGIIREGDLEKVANALLQNPDLLLVIEVCYDNIVALFCFP